MLNWLPKTNDEWVAVMSVVALLVFLEAGPKLLNLIKKNRDGRAK